MSDEIKPLPERLREAMAYLHARGRDADVAAVVELMEQHSQLWATYKELADAIEKTRREVCRDRITTPTPRRPPNRPE